VVERSGSKASSYRPEEARGNGDGGAASVGASEAEVTHRPGPLHPLSHWPHPVLAWCTDELPDGVSGECAVSAHAAPTGATACASAGVIPAARLAIARSRVANVRRQARIPVL
jgi:hypothetical protein